MADSIAYLGRTLLGGFGQDGADGSQQLQPKVRMVQAAAQECSQPRGHRCQGRTPVQQAPVQRWKQSTSDLIKHVLIGLRALPNLVLVLHQCQRRLGCLLQQALFDRCHGSCRGQHVF